MRNKRESGIALATAMLILLLVSSLMVGFAWMIMVDQRLGGNNADRQSAFYGAEAGMEELTANLANLFNGNYAPSGAQINALMAARPNIQNVQYLNPDTSSGYQIFFTADNNGNPAAQNHTIQSGPYQGLVGLLTPYTLRVTTRTASGSEVRLQRAVQTVGIPVFQFGIFSQNDLSFFAGPDFNFGGRVHSNGNIWLAEGDGRTLKLSDRVTAVGEVIRTNLSNGWLTANSYNGNVQPITSPNNFLSLPVNKGSLVGNLGTAINEPAWTQTSISTYNGNIRNGRTGARTLNMAITLLGAQPIDLIKLPIPNENVIAPGVLAERYFVQSSLRILLADTAAEITNLPTVCAVPVDLTTLGWDPLNPGNPARPLWYNTGMPPLPTSNAGNLVNYTASDGYWVKQHQPIISGFIAIEMQNAGGGCVDVTQEILKLGVAGRNTNPLPGGPAPVPLGQKLAALPGAQVPPSACADPSPNAVIRLERVRDNPSIAPNGGCGATPVLATDYWPLALFDPREGQNRDTVPAGANANNVRPAGVMYYVELDVNNVARWFTGAIPGTGINAINVTGYTVYFSDRRGNAADPVAARKTGEYGYNDFVNPASAAGCPNANLDTGENLDGDGTLRTYGKTPLAIPNALNNIPPTAAVDPNCAGLGLAPSVFLPPQDTRENPPLFFRHALKIRNGAAYNIGVCGCAPCGLTIVSENPAYVQGDYNALPNGNFGGAHAASAVIADAVTLLSNNWNDVNSFAFPYSGNGNGRNGTTTTYRTAVVSGKGISFPQPAGTAQDYGTDGGAHNFLRYIENWGGQQLFYRGSIVSFFFNRQAVGTYKCCTTVYSPPTRGYNFDVEFLQPCLLPPRTPMFRDVNTIGFTQLILPNQ